VGPEATGEIQADGRFHLVDLDRYWTEADHHPFLIRADGRLAGFALVAPTADFVAGATGHAIAEFFILRVWRRQGVGERAAQALFARFPGAWWVAQNVQNEPAQAFWRTVIDRYTGGRFDDQAPTSAGAGPVVQTFETR
jgi:predicted acetyltransferase